MFASLVQRLQGLQPGMPDAMINGRRLHTAPMRLIDSLPELGNVLYVPMCPHGATTSALPRGLLVDMMQLAPLLQTRTVVAASAITVEGPREWIDCLDREGRSCARLHLLPDTDYLAWDHLLEQGRPMHDSRPSRWLRQPRPACAKVLRFHTRRLAGLTVLGAEAGVPVSSLARQLAGRIARSEAVPLVMADDD